MQQAPPEGRRDAARVFVEDNDVETSDESRHKLKEAVETAASTYFAVCRKLARAINRLKQG